MMIPENEQEREVSNNNVQDFIQYKVEGEQQIIRIYVDGDKY